jgi:hypothetical protein
MKLPHHAQLELTAADAAYNAQQSSEVPVLAGGTAHCTLLRASARGSCNVVIAACQAGC